ncbi:hypothetical protein SLEP1_g12744 [Rubroshorea leprosula]|uniref:Uncharacterized protein n=1 Tax=Rubroshorea leprosula TaxID=152421 RepID=A0AAV5ILH5_9ROSI|nr:hypothetical protein SLEP1_g12744 [Rubroshorea leprosula]
MMHFINMGTFSRTPKEVNNGVRLVDKPCGGEGDVLLHC